MKDLKSLKKWMMFNGFANDVIRDSMNKSFKTEEANLFRMDAEFALVQLLAPFGLSMKTEPANSPFDASIYNLDDDFAIFLKWSDNDVTTGVYVLSEEAKKKHNKQLNAEQTIETIFRDFMGHVNGTNEEDEYVVFNGEDYMEIFENDECVEEVDYPEGMDDEDAHDFLEDFFYIIDEESDEEDYDEFSEFEDYSEGDFDEYDY